MNLSANGFFQVPAIARMLLPIPAAQTHDFGDNYSWETNTGTLYRYFVFGAAVNACP